MKFNIVLASALISSLKTAPVDNESVSLSRRLVDGLLGGLFGGGGIAAVDNGGHRTLSPETDTFKYNYNAGFGNWKGPQYVPVVGPCKGNCPPGPYPNPNLYPNPYQGQGGLPFLPQNQGQGQGQGGVQIPLPGQGQAGIQFPGQGGVQGQLQVPSFQQRSNVEEKEEDTKSE